MLTMLTIWLLKLERSPKNPNNNTYTIQTGINSPILFIPVPLPNYSIHALPLNQRVLKCSALDKNK